MPNTDFIPARDGDFDAWQQAFLTFAAANMAALGLVLSDITNLANAQGDWDTTYTAQQAAQAAAEGATAAKVAAKAEYIALIRSAVNRIQANPAVTNQQRESLGVTVRDSDPSPVPVPTEAPLASVDTSKRFQHTVTILGPDGGRGKPEGVKAAEVWVKIGGTTDEGIEGFTYAGQATRSSFVHSFANDDGYKTAHYAVRYINGKGEPGPWSEAVSATIAA